jgi:hypothetical protein
MFLKIIQVFIFIFIIIFFNARVFGSLLLFLFLAFEIATQKIL